MLTLIENGDLFAPEHLGKTSLLIAGEKIVKIGSISQRDLARADLECEVIDARKCVVMPGLIDPHEHVEGGTGESGFQSLTPPVFYTEIVTAGITTVIGTLGTDTTTIKHAGLLGRVKCTCAQGLSAWMYTGGYNVPPSTITGSIRDDIMLISEIIGVGEIAISDQRSTDPEPRELARLVNDSYVAGLLSGKAGITHFHVGEKDDGLRLLF